MEDNVTNTHLQAFNEKQGVELDQDYQVDGGSLSKWTWVDSHMIFYNTEGNATTTSEYVFTFETVILGVMSDSGGQFEAASTPLLGAAGTAYYAPFTARGFEGNDFYAISADMKSIRIHSAVSEPGDWIRYVTEAAPVPEPGTGLLCLVGFRKKFRK